MTKHKLFADIFHNVQLSLSKKKTKKKIVGAPASSHAQASQTPKLDAGGSMAHGSWLMVQADGWVGQKSNRGSLSLSLCCTHCQFAASIRSATQESGKERRGAFQLGSGAIIGDGITGIESTLKLNKLHNKRTFRSAPRSGVTGAPRFECVHLKKLRVKTATRQNATKVWKTIPRV